MMYLVCWMIDGMDHWIVTESKTEAMRRFNKLRQMDDVYTVSVCVPIASTDYDTVEL